MASFLRMTQVSEIHTRVANSNAVFTVNIEGKTYKCPVSRAALSELRKSQNPTHDRIDLYLDLKAKIHQAVERLIGDGRPPLPAVLELEHFG